MMELKQNPAYEVYGIFFRTLSTAVIQRWNNYFVITRNDVDV